MFAPPPRCTAEIFARLPETLRMDGVASEWRDGQPGHQPAHSFLEGPSFDRAGNLWCVDIAFGRILRVDPDGVFEVRATYAGEPNGLAFHEDGRLFIADYRNGIMVCDTRTGGVAPFLERHQMERLKAVNDLTFSRAGDLYFTDQGMTGLHDPTGRVFCRRADGRVECLLSNVPSPNGLVLSPDEDMLYVAVTRANAIWRVPLAQDGAVLKVGTFIQLSGGIGPDGLAMARDGSLVICHTGLGSVWVMSPLGEPVLRIASPLGVSTTNAAFGGPDRRRLFITESHSGTILACPTEVEGMPLYGGW